MCFWCSASVVNVSWYLLHCSFPHLNLWNNILIDAHVRLWPSCRHRLPVISVLNKSNFYCFYKLSLDIVSRYAFPNKQRNCFLWNVSSFLSTILLKDHVQQLWFSTCLVITEANRITQWKSIDVYWQNLFLLK